ncbi:hypothetical protein D3C77_714580 [compost metagenome]
MASIVVGLPIAILMMVMSYTLVRSLRQESFNGQPDLPPGGRLPVQEHSQEGVSQLRGPVLGGAAAANALTARRAS